MSLKFVQCTLLKNKSPQERYIVVQKLNYCFNCLSPNHKVTQCPSQNSCKFRNCNERHITLLHGGRPPIPSAQRSRSINVSVDSTTTTEHVLATQGEPNTTVLLQILSITIHNNDCHVTTYACLDQGSTCSILSKDMALALKIPLRNPKELTLRRINTACSQYVHEGDLEIADSSSSVKYLWKKVLVMENPQIPQLNINRSHVSASYKPLNANNFPILKTCDVTALLGLDVFDLMVGRNILSGPANTPTAVQCLLGWFLTGPCMSNSATIPNQNKIVDTYFCDDCFSWESALLD